MRKNPSTKNTALEAAKKTIEGEPISLNEYESLRVIKEAEDPVIESMVDEETMNKLAKIRYWAREKKPGKDMLRVLVGISKKFQKAEFKKKEKIK